ncbi:MAG: hypothetical protein IKF38_03680 [Clostridia bacterium]|nr:hypothetical protein [Clostridia bacterium]
MEIVKTLLFLIVFFLGLGFLVHICAKNKYILKYTSQKRKIEICPAQDKSHPTNR